MKWQGRRGSRNIEDRRRSGGTRKAGGIGGIAGVLILLAGWYFGVDVSNFVNLNGNQQTQGSTQVTAEDEQVAQFVSVTLADTEEVWAEVFEEQVGQTYTPPALVLFKGSTQSGCGFGSAQSGPFYCPADQKAYLDTDFFVTMERQLGAGGDFAAAYVVAHEVAHHVQNELGILGEANRVRAQVSPAESNAISVRIELQADCFSGLWARYAQDRFNSLERGDIAEAMNAAAQIGDDTLQRNAGQTVTPDSFQHGSSEQRQRWFMTGYETAEVAACDTFSTDDL
ncbi:neutral zinc metallopeptidase [Octadecabacter sp.]|nr:neutral zinc metallopeptidase [Octadecabacter sp.]